MRLLEQRALVGSANSNLQLVVRWVETVIAHSHPDLGRSGPMCPFVPAALREGAVYFGVIEESGIDAVYDAVLAHLDEHRGISATHRALSCVVMLAPNLAPEDLLEVHRRAKPVLVKAGLMLGEFLPGYTSPGLHNPAFHPLASPVPLLVIRHMVFGDDVFLADNLDWHAAYRRTVVKP